MPMHSGPRASSRGGFTLIELLVVMAILATLGALSLAGIPRILQARDRTVCQDRLKLVYTGLFQYQEAKKSLPKESGAEFVLGPWKTGIIENTRKDAEIFFCPSMTGVPDETLDLEDAVTAETIDFTGPDFSQYKKKVLRTHDRNANIRIIVSNKVPIVETEDDLDAMPHANKGIVTLTLSGISDFLYADTFAEGYVVIGPDSEKEELQKLVPGLDGR